MPMRRFKRISLIVAAATCLSLVGTLSAAANSGGPAPANPCKQFKKNSKAWKECMGQVKPGDASSADEQFAKGYWLAKTGDYEKALEILKALPNQDNADVLTMIGYATRHLGRVDEALGYYGKALALNPNLSNTRQYLGEAYLQKNDVTKARLELAEIGRICGSDACQDYSDLAKEIAAHEARG
jgi:tetratricopeptide (TPR) repeat protein